MDETTETDTGDQQHAKAMTDHAAIAKEVRERAAITRDSTRKERARVEQLIADAAAGTVAR